MKALFMKYVTWMIALVLVAAAALPAQGQSTKTTKGDDDPPAKVVPKVVRPRGASIDAKSYVIGDDDVLDIDVWKEKEISRTIPVRPDGKISLPLVGEIQASGLTPLQLQTDITQRLKAYIDNPEVTVIVDDPKSHQFNIVGQVVRPGTYPLSQSMTVLDALAAAGGFRDFAKETKIYVLRPMPGGIRVRIMFNYKDVIKGRDLQQNIALKPDDTIVVP